MALTDIQKSQIASKEVLYTILAQAATELNNTLINWKRFAHALNLIAPSDLEALTIPAASQTAMADFRALLNKFVEMYEWQTGGGDITMTNEPTTVLDKLIRIK